MNAAAAAGAAAVPENEPQVLESLCKEEGLHRVVLHGRQPPHVFEARVARLGLRGMRPMEARRGKERRGGWQVSRRQETRSEHGAQSAAAPAAHARAPSSCLAVRLKRAEDLPGPHAVLPVARQPPHVPDRREEQQGGTGWLRRDAVGAWRSSSESQARRRPAIHSQALPHHIASSASGRSRL